MMLPDPSLKMSEKDESGMHHVRYRYGECQTACFSFNPDGKDYQQCEFFRKLPTGVKLCVKGEIK